MNSRSRVERAVGHARAFAAEWDDLFDKDTLVPSFSKDKSSEWYILSAHFPNEIRTRVKKNTLALELGELAYQLRSALDGLIWDVVTHMKGTEPTPDAASRLEFPILNGKARDFKKCGLHDFPFPESLKDWLESIQPGSAEKPLGDPDRGMKTTLEDIHNIARFDRHRRLRVVAAMPATASLAVDTLPPGGVIQDRLLIPCDFLSGQEEIARIKVFCAGGLAPYSVRLKAKVAVEIFVEDIELYDGAGIMIQFERFLQAVDRAINRFQEEFSCHE